MPVPLMKSYDRIICALSVKRCNIPFRRLDGVIRIWSRFRPPDGLERGGLLEFDVRFPTSLTLYASPIRNGAIKN